MEWFDILETIIKWLIPVVCGWFLAWVTLNKKSSKALKNGMQCLLREKIIEKHEKWTERGYCPIYAKESLTRMYKAYHALDGNDVATVLYEEVMRLPEEKKED